MEAGFPPSARLSPATVSVEGQDMSYVQWTISFDVDLGFTVTRQRRSGNLMWWDEMAYVGLVTAEVHQLLDDELHWLLTTGDEGPAR